MKVDAKEPHQALRRALIDVIAEHRDNVSAGEALAVASQLVGQILLMQDPERMPVDAAWKLITGNILMGNQDALEQLQHRTGGIQ